MALLACLVVPQFCRGIETPQEYLQRAFKRRVMVIRNFYSDSNLQYGPDGRLLGDSPESDFLHAQVLVDGIVLQDDKIIADGSRITAEFNATTEEFENHLGVGGVHIEISLSAGIHTATELRKVLSQVFLNEGDDVSALVPPQMRAAARKWQLEQEEQVKVRDVSVEPEFHPPHLKQPSTEAHYSAEALRKRIQGTVRVLAIVDETGVPTNISVLQGIGYGLDEEALKAVAQWRFDPGTADGKPVPAQVTLEVGFHLDR